MKRCIAIPLEKGVLCAHFGHCEQFAIIEVENDAIKNIRTLTPPEHVPGLYPQWVAGFGVTDVIAGGMGQRAIGLFHEHGINVFVGAPAKGADELAIDFLSNNLDLQANYCDHDSDHHHSHKGCRH
ncbi:MAG: NifB/NifX family molybdenum-iron cluster-binding protein [Bacteroidales bacterium]